MKKKRTSLDTILGQEEREEIPTPEKEGKQEKQRRKRPNVVQQTVYLPPEVHDQLRRLAFEERCKMHDYLLEGLDRVFSDRGLKSIAELKEV
jgi:hypothetical protein